MLRIIYITGLLIASIANANKQSINIENQLGGLYAEKQKN